MKSYSHPIFHDSLSLHIQCITEARKRKKNSNSTHKQRKISHIWSPSSLDLREASIQRSLLRYKPWGSKIIIIEMEINLCTSRGAYPVILSERRGLNRIGQFKLWHRCVHLRWSFHVLMKVLVCSAWFRRLLYRFSFLTKWKQYRISKGCEFLRKEIWIWEAENV